MIPPTPFAELDDAAIDALAESAAPGVVENLRVLRDHARTLAAAAPAHVDGDPDAAFEP
jgi:tRNA A37 threonylcarbamoyltransferase TsaD